MTPPALEPREAVLDAEWEWTMGGQGSWAVRRLMSILVEMLPWSGRDGTSLDYGGSGVMPQAGGV